MKWLNRRAKFDYEIAEKFEVGVVLQGSEVKALRKGLGSIQEAYIAYANPHIVIFNMNIPEITQAFEKHEPRRTRILLVHKKEKNKMITNTQKKGKTIVPLEMYFNKRGIIKILCAIASGKTKADKRETIKEREWNREKEAEMKNNQSR